MVGRKLEQEYFADGMTEQLIADLSTVSSLRVISRTSVTLYKGAKKPLPQIARESGVDGVVEGSVLRSGDRVRITTQLIEAATDRHLWARSYERDVRDVPLGQTDRAFRWLQKSPADRGDCMVWLGVDPRFDAIRSNPRCQELMRQVGIPSRKERP